MKSAATVCNAPRLPSMAPLREVIETISYDDALRVERLSCGHTKTTLTPSERPAKRRRCWKCEFGEPVTKLSLPKSPAKTGPADGVRESAGSDHRTSGTSTSLPCISAALPGVPQ